VDEKIELLVRILKRELGLFLSISFGVFLFVLFFQPFQLEVIDFNNRLLVISGLGGIVFAFMFLIRVLFPWLNGNNDPDLSESFIPTRLNGLIIMALSSVAFVFYIHYVGSVNISFYIVFKILIICLAPPVVLGIYDLLRDLKQQNDVLVVEKKIIQKQIEKYEEDLLNKSIEFISENTSENFSLLIGEVVFIKSADNYVEIVYKEDNTFKKKLIRNTLRNVELQIRPYTNFIRCHRICIVNIHFIERLQRNGSNHWLTIKGYNEQLPVSRQYLLKLQEAL
jgi:DNA-binding LytR/AlgR family response regulator